MATLTQRIDNLAIALLNRVATPAQWDRLAVAVAAKQGENIAAMTQAQKAQMILDYSHELLIGTLREYEGRQSGIAAQSSKSVEVSTEFTPTL